MTRTEKDEFYALGWAGIPELPAEADEKTPVWIYAVARITTRTCRDSYAIVRMNYGRTPEIIKAFNDEGVAGIVSVHPYKFLDSRFVPKMESAAETKRYIANVYGVPEESVKKLKKEEQLRLFYTHCIKTQLAYEKEQSNKLPL